MSEAEQYQAIRKYWKDSLRMNQRLCSIEMWEAEHKVAHPSKRSILGGYLPVSRPENNIRQARYFSREIARLSGLLKKFNHSRER